MTPSDSASDSSKSDSEMNTFSDENMATNNEQQFLKACAEVLKIQVEKLDKSQSFIGLGGDSIAAITLIARCEERGIEVKTGDIINSNSILELFSTTKLRSPRDNDSPHSTVEGTPGPNEVEPERFSIWQDYSRAMPEERTKLLEQVAVKCGVEAGSIEDVYPCTPLQEGLMAISARKPAAYVDRRAFALAPNIDLRRFQAAWDTLIERTAILRTRIIMGTSGQSLQVVTRNGIPWRHGSTLKSYLAEDRKQGMQLGQPLARCGLVTELVDGGGATFVWTAHHSIYDGWSAQLLYRRLAAIYFQQLLPQSIPFTRFVRYLEGKDPVIAANYWRDQLQRANANSVAHWPALPHPNYQPSPRAQFKGEIPILDGAEQGLVMMSHILRAAWALVMSQYTGQDDVIFAVTLSGRNAPVSQVAEISAPLITTVPVRIGIDPTQTVGKFLQAVQRQAADMIDHEHTGLQMIKTVLPELHDVLKLQSLLVIQPASERDVYKAFPGLSPISLPMEDFDSYAVNVECTLGRQAVEIEVMYDDDVIAAADLTKVMEQFFFLVQELCCPLAQDRPLQEAMGISPSDRQLILDWNTTVPKPMNRCVHDLVTDQVMSRPTAIAVDAWDGELQYAELASQSISLAHFLVSLGVGPEQTVGLCMDKSKWAMVAMLATMYAGAAVLPLSGSSPLPRLQSIVQDAGTKVIIVDQGQKSRLEGLDANTVVIGTTLMANIPTTMEPPQVGITPQNIAWVVYTSGSTGTPKGVVLEHRSLCTSLTAHAAAMGINQYTRTLQFAAYTFDVSLCDIFSTLQAGGCVCVPSEEQRMNALEATAARMEITYAELTSTVAATLLPAELPSLSTLALSGEPLNPVVLSIWAQRTRVFNSYGPSECSIVCSNSQRLFHTQEARNIGRPMKSNFWVVQATDYQTLCPTGAPGELLIEGPLLARGYLHDEAKTKASFILDPKFVTQLGLPSGRRMYRTGDLVSQNSDGSLLYLGRCNSQQVKIRGQRVDVSEIEYQITQQLSGTGSVAVELVERGAQINLVALMNFAPNSPYMRTVPVPVTKNAIAGSALVANETLASTFQELRMKLLQSLPAYMVPTLYIPMADMPTNASGKLDRLAIRAYLNTLSLLDLQRFMPNAGPKAAPTTDMEKRLQALWAETLQIDTETIGRGDDFFQIGGDSVAAMRMVALQVARELQLTVATIFQHSNLSHLAHFLEEQSVEEQPEEPDPEPFTLWQGLAHADSVSQAQRLEWIARRCDVSVEEIEDVYPCTPTQEGLIAITAHQHSAYVSRQVYRLASSIELDRLQAAWETLATVTPILRTRILVDQEVNESRFVQVVVRRQLSWQHSSDLDQYMGSDQDKEIQLGHPLVRLALVQHPTERFLVWTAHHSVYDGWSAGLMHQHLADIYLHDRIPSAVPYPRFIRHLLRRDHAADVKYWSSQLQGDLVVNWPPLPQEGYQPKPMHRDIYNMPLRASKIHTRPASALPAILRAAWALVMVKYAGQGHSVVFGMTLAGRNLPVRQLTELVAPTITTVPIRIDVNQKQSVRDFLQMVQQQATEMMDFENTGLQGIRKLVPELRPVVEVRNLLAIQPAWEDQDTVFPEMEALPVSMEGFDIYPLTVQCSLGLDAITVETRYDENVIAGAQVKRMVRCLEHVVKQLYSTHTDTYQVRDISLVSTDDQDAILRWNGTAAPRVEQCIHHLVADQINQRPDSTAICAWDGNLTYKELANYSSQLAWYLKDLQVGAENMVGVCMDKSKWAGIAMLAILQAGGVVVPLGVAHPMARLTGILEDTRANIILVDAEQRARLSSLPDVKLVVVNESLLQTIPAREDTLNARVGPDNAAWVIYTSGSTGKPKGVVLQHRALCSSIKAHGARFGMNSQTRMLQFAAHTFDACIQDYFTTLSWGGVVCVPNEEERMSDFTMAMHRMEVTFATLTSTVARLIHPPDVPSMQQLALVGEPVKADVVKQWLPYVTVLNAYGPSECSIHSSCSEPLIDPKQASIIGTSMGTRLWVVDVDDFNQLCPIGAPGELLIEGPLLAREYLNDEAKTRAAFVFEPSFIQQLNIQSDHGERWRMYRTGDMVRQNEDGSITHLGRRDTQVKINGQRVEVGEIEYQITQQLPGARSAAVQLLQESASEQVSLIAVVDFQEGCEHRDGPVMSHGLLQPTPALHTALRKLPGTLFQLLPTYMVPAVFLPILEMPLNASGKLDRRAIGELLKAIRPEHRQKYLSAGELSIEPATPIQRKLQELWAGVLHVPVSQINIYDNFFQIGGDSVVAMRLVTTAAGRQLQVTVADIFQQPRLADLAEQLSTRLLPMEELNNDPQPFSLWLGENPVAQQQHGQLQEIANQCSTVVENIQDAYPCTPLQQELMATTAEQSSAYVNRLTFKLDPNLDLDRFQESWRILTTTTPILRTRIVTSSEPSKPLLQVVLDEEISWNFSDSLDNYLACDQQDEMGPGTRLVRYGLVRDHNSEERFFVWTAHHSLYDGWSTGLLYKNFTEIFQSGHVQSPVPFTRFIRFLRNQEEDEKKKMDRAEYWSNQLQGDVMNNWPSLPHVGYRPRPGLELTQVVSLGAHGSGSTVTASNVLRAAWGLLMAQYSGHNDVVFAATLSGRNAPVLGVESMVAPTITTVPVRVQIDWNQDVTSFLNSVQEQAVQMIDYEHTGLRTIKTLISPESRPALELRNVLVVQTAEEASANKQFPGVQQLSGGAVTEFDSHILTVDCTLSPVELRVAIRYDEHVVPTPQVQRILSQLTHLVQQLYNPALIKSRNLGELDLITPADKQLIFEHNALVDVSRVDQCIHTLVYKQVLARPSSPAVCAWDGNLTYSEMFSQAVRLAHFLVDAGVGPETKVGLCMDKSKFAIVAMLGTLFAGGVIVPLGVTNPISRLKIIVQDTAANVILVDAEQQVRLGSLDLNVNLVIVDTALLDGLASKTHAPVTTVTPDNAAWIIYTSGTTGTPKGLVLEHGGLCTSMRTQANKMNISSETRALQFSPFTFDVSISDVSATLIYGGCVCMPSEDDRFNNLAETMRIMMVNFASLTPTVAHLISPAETPSLHTIALTGEALTPEVIELWNQPGVSIYNTYGPSEGSVCTANGPVLHPEEALTIGTPMATRHWVTHPHNHNQLCPIGATGELLIEGPLVARGYLNNPKKTAVSFIAKPDFLSTSSGCRFYKTGDLVCEQADGSFAYIGRRDTQVKIRGQRVEIGQIEHQIAQKLPQAQTTVVHLLELDTKMFLVAAIQFRKDGEQTAADTKSLKPLVPTSSLRSAFATLRHGLLEVLPTYMVPLFYVPVAHIPLNTSGKLDRRAVETFLRGIPSSSLAAYIADETQLKTAPSTPMETFIQPIWAQVLGVPIKEVGAHDDFFHLGGDSVTAMRMVAATNKESKELKLAVTDIFQNPRLSDLARVMEEKAMENERVSALERDPIPFALWEESLNTEADKRPARLALIAEQCGVSVEQIDDVYPCTPLQEALLASTARQPSAYVSRQMYALSDNIDIDRFQAAWQTLASSIPILRTRAIIDADGSWQVVVREDLTWLQHSSLKDYMKQDEEAGIQLGQPLARYGLIFPPSSDVVFVWTAHHSIYDGFSIRLMCEELIHIYNQADYIPRSIPFSRLIRYLTKINTSDSLAYWDMQLEGDVMADWPPLPNAGYEPRPRISICKKVTAAPHQGQSILMANVLRAAWGLTMVQFSGHSDVVYAANVSGRNAPVHEVSEIIAPTITTVPLRIQVSTDGSQSVEDFLRGVQDQAIKMIDYEHTGLRGILSHPALQLRNLLVIQTTAESDTTLDFPGIEALPLAVEDFDSYGLNVQCTLGQTIGIEARFDSNIVSTTYTTRVLDQFTHILEQLCDQNLQSHPLLELDFLSSADQSQIATWNATVPERVDKCVHELVQEQARACPTSQAICAWDGILSYRELTKMADFLALELVALGVELEQMVGVSMSKSKWAAVALLATLQAGGVVVPLSVSHPTHRIETIVNDTEATVILVDDSEYRRLKGSVNCQLLVVDSQLLERLSITPASDLRSCPLVTSDHAAWVIYTSGTTGTPKGAVLEHGTLCTSIQSHGARYGFGTHTRKLQYAAHTFDGTIEDYFTTLAWGGLCCVPSEDDRLDIRKLTAFMRRTEVNALATTYTVAGLFSPEEVPTLRLLVLGGEPATVEVTNLWRTKVDLFNCYGPSECSIFSSAAGPVQNVDEIHNIGHAIGTRLWVADPQNYNLLCPVGAPGELLIEGPQLARGYLNNKTKTNEHFILDPQFMSKFGLTTGRRVYRSGDIVRQKDDGSFVYVARRDTQVKIRGQRVEIGEIEHQIARHLPETRAVAVELITRGANSQPVLVGAIEFAPDSRYQTGDIQAPSLKLRILPPTMLMTEAFQKLHSALVQVLPTHMVPASYLPVAQMPRNLSGKLDRRTLREQLTLMSAESMLQYLEGGEKIPPSTEMEYKLHALWLEALGVEQSDRVGVSDNFFQLGGDSVAAMRLAAMTWQQHNLHLTVADVFHHPRLCDLAQNMTERSFELVSEEEDPDPFTLWVNASPEAVHDIATRCCVDVSQIEDIYPCTPLQEGFMATTTRQSSAYISRQVYSLSATEIDLDRFKSAWETLNHTTPILRTRLMMGHNKEAIQVVVQSPIVWRSNDDLASYIADDREEGMVLDQPLVRYGLVTESADKSYFIWTTHHSVYDGWTMREIARRFVEIYNSNNHTWAHSIIPYSRFIRYLVRQDPVETINYWQNELTGEVVTDWPPLPQIGYHPRPQSRIQKTIALPKQSNEGILVSTILRAAWAIVMVQYSGNNDIAFAASVSGRHAAVRQIKEIAGPTLTTVPQQSTEMIPYEQTGLQKINELLREMSGSALALRNLLVIQPAAETDNNPIALSGLESLPVPFEDFGSFGLQVECTLGSNEIEVDVQYDEQVIASLNVLKVVDYFVHIVKELSNFNRFEQPLHMLHVSPQDEDQILAWNRVGPTRSDQCIHNLVFNRVLRQPTASAICAWDGDFTYTELSCHAARLAAHLILDMGIKPEKTVGLCMDKSKWAAVAMLAVLYAGGVAVPLGVTHPLTRVQGITQDAAVETVLVDSEQHQRLASLGLRLFSVDAESIEKLTPVDLVQTTALIRDNGVAPHNMAWIVYTSGSTGTPKGVILEHRALSTSIEAHGVEFKMDNTTRTLQFSAHTFDVTIQDLFTTLWAGGCVCIPSEHDRVNRLTTSMMSMNVNFATLTSTVASMLVPQQIPSMRTLILVGEPVTAAAVALWSPHATVLNAYGPSECSIHSSCSRPMHDAALASNIGFPLACSWWVVQAENHHALCPIGAPGELMIEGPNQARGYLNDEEKTRAAFVTDPDFMRQLGLSGRRLYRTGDLVKQNPDGSLIHLGRTDLQVKIRGQRIEVGEIEYQIQQHLEGVRTVAVERIQHGADGKQVSLVAVFDMMSESNENPARGGPQPLAPSDYLRAIFNDLRQTLFRVLPGYMVPAAYLPVEQMPSNANNKLDRRAIRELLAQHSLTHLQQYIQHEGGEMKALPVTALEKQVHALWLEVLDISDGAAGMNDNFFHLGGDSVTAMRMVVVAASQGLQLSVEDIFKWPQLVDLTSNLAERPSEDLFAHETKDPTPFSMWKDLYNCSTDEREETLSRVAKSIGVEKEQIEDIYPCTPLQEGLMAVTAKQSAAYVSRQVYSMGKSTNREQFKAAWETLSAEVSILRSRIIMESSAVQVVVRGTILWQYGTDLQQYLQVDRDKGMSLGQPLVRYGFVEEPSGECYFIWTAHHALYDGWTVSTLSKRLAEIYHSKQSRSSVPFTRFIQYLQNGRPDTAFSTDYWRDQLEGDVMASWPRRPTDIQPLPQEDLQQVISLPATQRQCKVTMSTILRAAWSLVVAQYSGHGDIAFAATVSGRNARVRGISDIAGPTITTVPIRINVEQTQSVARYLEAIQLQATNMIEHEHTGLQGIKALVPELAPTLDTGTLLVIQAADESGSDGQLAFPGMETIPMPIEPFNAHAITLECKLGQQQVIFDVHYDKNIIPCSQMKHVMDYFACLIHRLCEPVVQSESVADILAIDQGSQEQILQWNTEVPARLEKCIHEMVREQVDRSPSGTAISAWDGDLTYGEFYSAAARLAHHLVSLHVSPESVVGFCMEKSKWGSVAMLAIMQAGGAIMPLGIMHPLARIESIIETSQARVIVVSPEQGERLRGLSSFAHVKLVVLDQESFDGLPYYTQPPDTGVTPSNASWAIFTSGSSGIPKGVIIEHGTMSTSLDEQGRWLGLTPSTRFLQFASYTFDNIITDTFATTAFGGVVCVPSEEDRMNRLTEVMADMNVNTAMLTSTVAQQIAPISLPAMRKLILTGESVRADVVSLWLDDVEVYNAYGPTEGSMSTCTRPYTSAYEVSNIGFPLATRLWVTQPNNDNLLSPIGAPGELWIEGPFLARGYLGDPARTDASFIVDPEFTGRLNLHGRRLYRTGDLVRQNEDGTLIYLGRLDSQIKIRGQRVELGEIEHQILHHLPGVSAVAVVPLTEDQDQRITLVAVVEFAADTAHRLVPITPSGILPLSTELQTVFAKLYQILLRKLPLYMVPPVFLPIAEMTRNLSGKLDRKSLRALLVSIEGDNIHEYRVSDRPKVAPSTNMERDLQALWAKGLNLKLESIGANDDFFHIGGDSLAAMRIVAASHSRSYTLTVADIFKYSCLSDLALILSAQAENETPVVSDDEVAPFSLIGSDNPEEFIQNVVYPVYNCSTRDVIDILPTTDFQAMTVAGVLTTPRAANCAHFLLDGNGTCDIETLRKSCSDLIKTLPVLRTAYVFDQGRLLQVIKRVHEPKIRIFSTDRSIEAMTSEIINQQLLPPPRLGEAFTQVAIIEESRSSRHRVLLRMTHAEYDAVSVEAVWESLKRLIEGTVPHPQPSFSAFLYHQQQSIAPKTYKYWTDLLSGSSMTILGSSSTAIGQYPSQVVHLAPQTIKCVNPQSEGMTIAILVKAAWAVTLSRFSNSQDVVFGDTVSMRGTVKASLMNAMGCCVTLLPVRVQLSNEATVRELLHKIRGQQIQSLDHAQLGFREILHECTDWVTSTRFTSTFNHISEQTRTLDVGSQEYAISSFETPDATWTGDVGVTAVSRNGELDLRISYRSGSISKEMALKYLRTLGDTVRTFLDDSSQTLNETMSPFETPIIPPMTKPQKKGPIVQLTKLISKEDGMTCDKLQKTREWEAVLQHRRGVESRKTRIPSFAQRGGDLLDAVYLSSLLGDGDRSISALDILAESQEDGDGPVDAPPSKKRRTSLKMVWARLRKGYARSMAIQSSRH
ncbi:hypothetical protein N7447_010495 [Penicillium robsamsonii]|uniref:uncharacterized protein n=1 Tax=Penicillium robsamsonii TaxID=1792511 RepID=UPI002546DFE1|nr:uncharacterized protein N7447_010495 [Penicillium robsamsonii]KAJ5810979.1 hypothetical protein N7447_010495 [Penicillium robsamsonii]